MKYFTYISIPLLVIALSTTTAYAHFLKIDNAIGSVMHIDPDDNPTAGQASTITFELKDTKHLLDIVHCDCAMTISANNAVVYAKTINAAAEGFTGNTIVEAYTFPMKATYDIALSGSPMPGYAFQPFSIHYSIVVDHGSDTIAVPTTKPSWWKSFLGGHTLHYILFGGAIIYATIVIIRDKRRDARNYIKHE